MPLTLYSEGPSIKKIIGVAAGKGGVGKSTVAAYLASAYRFLGYKVGLLDADLYGPSLRKMLPEQTLPFVQGHQIIPANCSGIKMISMAFFKGHDEALAMRAPMANAWVAQFFNQVIWGPLDILIVDLPPGTGDIPLTIVQKAKVSAFLIVTTPQEISLIDVRKTMDLFKKVNIPFLGIVENMSYYFHETSQEKIFLYGKGGGAKLAAQYHIPLLAEIPFEPKIAANADQGTLLFESDPEHPIVKTYLHLAKQFMENSNVEHSILIKNYSNKEESLIIEWEDGLIKEYPYKKIQSYCPCAQCQTYQNKKDDSDIKTYSIKKIGQYALHFTFSSGCSHGIYPFTLLRGI